MKPDEFAPSAPGQLAPIPGGFAFIPDPLPVPIEISGATWRLLDEARGVLGEYMGESRRFTNQRLITGPLLTIEAVRSNEIEGTHTRLVDVLRQQSPGAAQSAEAPSLATEAVLRYQRALEAGAAWLEEGRGLSQALIRGLHQSLLKDSRGADHHPGEYRRTQVVIGDSRDPLSARFVPPPYEHISSLMDNLEAQMKETFELPPLIACAVCHYQLETIHPFEDGNGRMGRILIPLFLQYHGTIDRPILYLSDYFHDHEQEYRERLRKVSTNDAWDEWIAFFLRAVAAQARRAIAHVRRLDLIRETYSEAIRNGTRSRAALAAVDLLMTDVFVTVPMLRDYVGASYGGAKEAVTALEGLGILRPIQDAYPATWFAETLFNEVYTSPD